jgi:hypothetical protein
MDRKIPGSKCLGGSDHTIGALVGIDTACKQNPDTVIYVFGSCALSTDVKLDIVEAGVWKRSYMCRL